MQGCMAEVESMNRLNIGKEKNIDWPKDGVGKSQGPGSQAVISQCISGRILCTMIEWY